METLLEPGALGAVTLVLGLLLAFAARYLRVEEDPRIEHVRDLLPGANCGACGQPGCRAFAEVLVAGAARPAECSVGSSADHARIARFLGVDPGAVRRRVARVACAGGANVARLKAAYQGAPICRTADTVAGAGKGCAFGCLGFGDCAVSCDFDAIRMDEQGLPRINPALCVACGDCVRVCPRDLIEIIPEDNRLFVACRSSQRGDDVLAECAVGCTACGKCAFDLPELIRMNDELNLPVVGHRPVNPDEETAIERCPTGAIVFLDEDGAGAGRRGREAPVIARRSPLPVARVMN